MAEKKSFIMYKNWATLLVGLPEEDVGQIMKAICSKELDKEYEITSQTAQAVFDMMAPQLDEDDAKYQAKCEQGRMYANKRWGNKDECNTNVSEMDANPSEKNGNPSKEDANPSNKNGYPSKNNGYPSKENGYPMPTHSDNDNDNDTDNDNDNDTPNGVYKASAKADARDTRVSRSDVEAVITTWNDLPDPVPKVAKMSAQSTRAKSLKARISQYGFDEVMRAIENVRNSPFLLGQVKDFVITFDWFVKPNNFSKVLDGNYLGRDAPSERSGTTYGMSQQELDEGAARIEAAMALERGELYGEQ